MPTLRPMNLTQDPIGPLIQKLAIPASVGFFFNTMYNVVDTYYAGSLSTDALAALSIAFPVFFILIAISNGLSQGATALMAHALGAKTEEAAFFTASGRWPESRRPSDRGKSVGPQHVSHAWGRRVLFDAFLTYMNIIWAGTFFIAQSMINATLQAQGDTTTYRNLLIVGFFSICRSIPANAWRPWRAGNGHGWYCPGDGAYSGRRGVLPGLPRDGFL